MTNTKFLDYEKEEEYEEEEVKVPRRPGEAPDGGWGWVIVMAALMCSLLIHGVLYAADLMRDKIAEKFDVNAEELEPVSVLMFAFSCITGPLTSGLMKKFGCRKVAMSGSLVTFAALVISSQMTGVVLLRFTYGVLGGIGLNMVYQPSIVIVAAWFEHKRALATGIAVMGAGFGVFVFGPLIKYLLNNNDWKYTLAITAAVFLHCAVAGALFRPLTYAKNKGMKRGVIQRGAIMKALIAEKERQRTISNGSLDNCIITKDNRLIKIDKIDLRNKSNSYINRIKESFGFSSRSLNRSKNSLVVPKVVVDTPIYRPKSPHASVKTVKATPKPVSSPPSPKRDSSGSDSGCGSLEGSPKLKPQNYEALPSNDPWEGNLIVKLPPKGTTAGDAAAAAAAATATATGEDKSTLEVINNLDTPCTSTLKHPDHEKLVEGSFHSNNASPVGSLRNVNIRPSTSRRIRTVSNSTTTSGRSYLIDIPMQGGSVMTVPSSLRHSMEMSTIYEEEERNCKVCRKVCKLLDLELLRSPTFLLLSLTGFLTMFGFVIPFVHLPIKAQSVQVPESRSHFLISILWALHMIGSILQGWLADRPIVSPVQLNNVMMVLAGFLSFFSPMYNSYALLAFYAAMFGLFSASFFTLRSIMLVELFGKERLTCAFGLLLFTQGFAVLAGHFLSHSLSGNMAFTVVGVLLVGSGILGFPLTRIKLWESRRKGTPNKLNLWDNENGEFEIVNIEEISPSETLQVEQCESSI